MAKKQQSRQGTRSDNGMSPEMGVGLAVAATAAIAGAYFLYGAKDAKKNRKMVSGWMLKAKGEVLEKMENMKETVTEEAYYRIVDAVVGKYGTVKNSSQEEVDALGRELKSHWKNIKKHLITKKTKPKGKQKRKTQKKTKKKTSKNK